TPARSYDSGAGERTRRTPEPVEGDGDRPAGKGEERSGGERGSGNDEARRDEAPARRASECVERSGCAESEKASPSTDLSRPNGRRCVARTRGPAGPRSPGCVLHATDGTVAASIVAPRPTPPARRSDH